MCNSKVIEISPDQYARLLRFLFTEDSPEFLEFFDKKNIL